MLDRLKNVDMSQVKACAKTYASNAKSYAKSLGVKALDQVKYAGSKKVSIAGKSVNPFIIGAAALAIIGGTAYILMKRRNKMQLAGMSDLEAQEYPVK